MKICSSCNQSLPLSDFYTKGKNGRVNSLCKSCFNSYCVNRWIKRKEYAIEYKGNKCSRCEQTYPYPVYEFHHRNPLEKDFDWNKLKKRTIESIEFELDKCDMLCANCHRIVHHEMRMVSPSGIEPE